MYETPDAIDPAYAEFLDLFNRGRFWDSHEALETAWRRTGSDFYHALILFASAFVHVDRGNRHGIAAQLGKAEPLFQRYRPAYLGLDIDRMIEHSATCRQLVAENPDVPPDAWSVLIPYPRLDYDPGRVTGDEAELKGTG
jgi:predicted metal-dependent hydrolase